LSAACASHDLRHTFCRLYLEGGGTIADLMQITGHQSIVMMRVYSNFEVKYKADRMDAINLPPELEQKATGQVQGSSGHLEVTNGDMGTPNVTNEDQEDDDNSASAGAIL
jgi:hypothetical protein